MGDQFRSVWLATARACRRRLHACWQSAGECFAGERRRAARAPAPWRRSAVPATRALSLESDGHANRYQLFVERAIALTRPGGRFGLVLPSGLATDHGSAALRRMLFSRCDVDAIVGLDNHRGVFPIHRSVRFLLVTATHGAPAGPIACRLGVDDPMELESIGDEAADHSAWFPYGIAALLERNLRPRARPANLRTARSRDRRARGVAFPRSARIRWSVRFGGS